MYAELLIAGLALITIGVALVLSALGLITIPEGLYSSLAAIALAAIGTRGRRVVQRRAVKRRYAETDDQADMDGYEEEGEVEHDGGPPT